MAIFKHENPDGDRLKVTGPSVDSDLMFCVIDSESVALVELDATAAERLRDVLTEWLEPKPCTSQREINHRYPGRRGSRREVGVRCQAGDEGHDGPHRFEVTW